MERMRDEDDDTRRTMQMRKRRYETERRKGR
jgi:hypothetical protein